MFGGRVNAVTPLLEEDELLELDDEDELLEEEDEDELLLEEELEVLEDEVVQELL